MFCPVCKGEFREGFTECSGCRVGLVEDLNNLPEHIEGEFKLCVSCEKRYSSEIELCEDCGTKAVRALEGEDGYVLLEEVDLRGPKEPSFDLSSYRYCVDLSDEDAEILLESEDMQIMHRLMSLLDEKGINFSFVPPSEQAASALGSVFGMNSPLARSFPQILVRVEDLEAATHLLASDPELGLFEMPEELMGDDDEENEL
jgi:hypothetical protein